MAVSMMLLEGYEPKGRKVAGSYDGKPMDFDVTYEGLVVGLRERNGYDDSDFYAIVWNAEKGAPEEIMYATTRGWSYPNHAVVDASPEVKAAYDAYLERQEAEARRMAAEREARIPRRGRKVEVVKGRKVPKGTKGEVFWYGETQYGWRVGIVKDDGEKVFTAASNVSVIAQS